MRGFRSLLRRFHKDERGAFLVLFGVLAIVLVATSGAVVDYTAVEQARTRAQVALDTAALGLQPTIFQSGVTEETVKAASETLLLQQLNASGGEGWAICDAMAVAPCLRVDDVVIEPDNGTLHLEAMVKMPTAFVSLIGFPSLQARLVSEATRKKLDLELVMVLDNSGSMNDHNRMAELKEAAKCAANVLFNLECDATDTVLTSDEVKIGIVPFTEFVNVGTGNASASWMDRTGAARITRHNFDDDSNENTAFTAAFDRLDIYGDLRNTSWEGCVEARLPPYDTDDTEPVSGDTLFTPAIAPDEPDGIFSGFYNSYISDQRASCPTPPRWVFRQVKTKCSYDGENNKPHNHNRSCSGTRTNTITTTSETGAVTTVTNNTNLSAPVSTQPTEIYGNPASCSDSYNSSGSGSNITNTYTRTCNYYFSDRELQERICKYDGATPSQWFVDGPNTDCPDNAVMPLTNSLSTIKSQINAMESDGGTNIHQGAIWGYHLLSPTEPFTEGDDYDSGVYKVMIIMTDGENTHSHYGNMNGASWYVAYGYPYNGRLTGASTDALQDEMDVRTAATCENAKAMKDDYPGITIYTIGLSAPNADTVTLLTNCASDATKAHFPDDDDDLTDVFEEIAEELSTLRLAR